MPEISRFLGISITMYFNDHMPPHFHAPRITGFVIEWASLHQNELMTNWNLLNTKGIFNKVPPLV